MNGPDPEIQMTKKWLWTGASVIACAVLAVCSIDHGLAPLPGQLRAKVIFANNPPSNTQGIYLIVAPQFPPHAINELFHSPNSLPIDRDTVIATMELPYGHYEALSLWWYNTETKSNLADVLALPLDPKNGLLPLGFDITAEKPVYEIELTANWQQVNRNASIEGTIDFNGPFPPNTSVTAVAAYIQKPTASVQYLIWLKSIDFSIDSNPYHYILPVRQGTINHIAVFWLPERAALTDFYTIGVYEDPARPGQPGSLRVRENDKITGIDIHADWSLASPAGEAGL